MLNLLVDKSCKVMICQATVVPVVSDRAVHSLETTDPVASRSFWFPPLKYSAFLEFLFCGLFNSFEDFFQAAETTSRTGEDWDTHTLFRYILFTSTVFRFTISLSLSNTEKNKTNRRARASLIKRVGRRGYRVGEWVISKPFDCNVCKMCKSLSIDY